MKIDLNKGQVLNNQEIVDLFKCSPQGGMRYSKRTDTLVIVSNHIKSVYGDRWEENVLHYTGMGQVGNQSKSFRSNFHLSNSKNSDISIFLFEVFKTAEYTFQGQVELIDKPYQEKQIDVEGEERLVWMFPLVLLDRSKPSIDLEILQNLTKVKEKNARKLKLEKLKSLVRTSNKKPSKRSTKTDQYDRNPFVKEYALRRADGFCQLCEKKAPFKRKDGTPYLEVHHINYLRNGGEDTVTNTVALCPNCHRRVHTLEIEEEFNKMKKLAQNELK